MMNHYSITDTGYTWLQIYVDVFFREAFMDSERDENWYHLQSMKSKYDTRL